MDVSADRIRQARIDRGWTQQQLAEIADLSLRTVQRVENQAVASNETVSSLCAVLEVERSELLLQDPSRPEHQAAAQQLQRLLPIAVLIGAALGSGATVLVMQLVAVPN